MSFPHFSPFFIRKMLSYVCDEPSASCLLQKIFFPFLCSYVFFITPSLCAIFVVLIHSLPVSYSSLHASSFIPYSYFSSLIKYLSFPVSFIPLSFPILFPINFLVFALSAPFSPNFRCEIMARMLTMF